MPRVELLGLARHYAGVPEVVVSGTTLGEVLLQLGRACPGFASRCSTGKKLPTGLIACLNERQFTGDESQPVSDSDRILILSADVGGA